MFTILNSQSHPRLNRLQNFPKSYKIKPTPSQSSVTSRTVAHNIVGKELKRGTQEAKQELLFGGTQEAEKELLFRMHKNQLGTDNRARECSTHRSQEHVEILRKLATLIAARTTRGRPGRASVAVQQFITQFRLYSDFKMTPQEVNRVANLPEWTRVLK